MSNRWKEAFDAIRASTKGPDQRYFIAFTARSGSTWLCNLLSNTGVLGSPEEWFNPNAVHKVLQQSGCTNIPAFYHYLQLNQSPGGVFGSEITWQQLAQVFKLAPRNLFDDVDHWFFLRRRDYVAQAVSLFKAERSGLFHSVQHKRVPQPVVYDGQAIANAAMRSLSSETRFCEYFARQNILSTELWYEDLTSAPPADVVRLFSDTLGLGDAALDGLPDSAFKSRHSKIGDSQNDEMIVRFREENPAFIEYWDRNREQKTRADYVQEFGE